MSAVERLRQNDPERTDMGIRLHDEPADADLAQALQQNPFVTVIHLGLNGSRADWNSLLQVFATRANLETVALVDALRAEHRNPALVSAILRAIQQNSAIRTVEFAWMRLPADFSTFVDTASSITSYSILACDMEAAEREQGTNDLVAALQRNSNIQTLRLRDLDDLYAIPILQGLRSNISLKTLSLGGTSFSDAPAAGAIHQLLQSTASIETFELFNATLSERQFPWIAQAITSSESVSKLKFRYCIFKDQSSIAQLQSVLQHKQNLTSLCFYCCGFSVVPFPSDIISALLRPDSPLRSFEWTGSFLRNALPDTRFQKLLRAVQESKLEHFAIGDIQFQQELRTLSGYIPKMMRIKELHVVTAIPVVEEIDKQVLLQAVKNNFSLRFVDGKRSRGGEDLFDADDKTRLVFYANRNELLDQWVGNPESVEQKVWPDALKLAEKAGPNSLFRGLRSLVESDYVSLGAGRKRKRPQYDSPP